MPTIVSHPAILLALRPAFKLPFAVYFAGTLCSILPDFDVIGFRFGIHYGDILGHRGLTHSIFFAIILSAFMTFFFKKTSDDYGQIGFRIFCFFFLCTVSHGILDAFTDGGLGVAFFSPFSNTRYFFSYRPLEVSPIGIRNFLSGPAISVLKTEILYIWIPSVVLFFVGIALQMRNYRNS